ncbi:22671_t:CDS:2 [Gigaspora rosea]|nr:22671_t:CDS:2 [Gigaspora rosea]
MPCKNSTINHLKNTINSPKSTPEQIQKAFIKYIESIKNYYKCNRSNISQEYYEDNIRILDSLKSWINSTKENKALKTVITNSAQVYNNNDEQYQSEIARLRQIVAEISLACQECSIDFNIVNGILQNNGIKILGPRKHYMSYQEALDATGLQKINQDGYSLQRSFSFYEPEPNQEEGECSYRRAIEEGECSYNRAIEESSKYDTEIFDF